MKSISQIQLRNDQGVIRDHYSCTILDADFYKKYNIPMKKSQMTYMKSKAQNAVVPSQSISEIQVSDNSEQMLSNNKDILKRVSLRAIEIDWIFKGDRASSFLKELSDTENLEIFNLDIIKDIILLQWKYFKIAIILKLFLPYLLYFAMFWVYATYLIERQYEENKTGEYYDITSYVIGWAILLFNMFWAYIEIRQIILNGKEYFTSFWNYLDWSSIIMNWVVVTMNFGGASFQDTNRVAALSVLVLYFKLFYFLRIFSSTAYLVRMIIEIMLDMKFFVGVLILATTAFGNAFYILGRNSPEEEGNLAGDNFVDAFIFSYKMGLGDFSTYGFSTKDEEMLWIFFLLNSLIILIVLLNLLIAIMGDTFDRVQETQESSMYRELASMILENELE